MVAAECRRCCSIWCWRRPGVGVSSLRARRQSGCYVVIFRDGHGARCSSAGYGGAVALEGRDVYLPWAETLYYDPAVDTVARARARRCEPGRLMGRGYGRNGRTSMIGLLVGWHLRHGGSHWQGLHRITCQLKQQRRSFRHGNM